MDFTTILSKSVSFQEDAFSKISRELTISSVLDDIKDKKYEKHIEYLRELLIKGKKDDYDMHKRNLPGVTFCGTFKDRRIKEHIVNYNEHIVIDTDKLKVEALAHIKSKLTCEEYVLSFWVSPSKIGVKGLVPLQYEMEVTKDNLDLLHKSAFNKLLSYFKKRHDITLDNSGSDTSRLCFYSSDPELILKNNITYFNISLQDIDNKNSKSKKKHTAGKKPREISYKQKLYDPRERNDPQNRAKIQSVFKYLRKRNLSITDSFDQWYRVAYAIANTFTYDIGEEYFLRLCRLDGPKHDELKSNNLLIYCYENSKEKITFGTILHYAKDVGYKL